MKTIILLLTLPIITSCASWFDAPSPIVLKYTMPAELLAPCENLSPIDNDDNKLAWQTIISNNNKALKCSYKHDAIVKWYNTINNL